LVRVRNVVSVKEMIQLYFLKIKLECNGVLALGMGMLFLD
jgi:hypothetical protein